MFYYVEGTVAHTEPGLAVIDCGGVGYACRTTLYTLAGLKPGGRARLFTWLYVREDAFDLYGFSTEGELNCFKLLITVSGVGPKAAVSLLSAVSPEALALAVLTEDAKALTTAPGVGRKLAQRIILEMKDKMAGTSLASIAVPGASALPGVSGRLGEAAAALQVLGYSATDAAAALKGLDPEVLSVEEMVRLALKGMARSR